MTKSTAEFPPAPEAMREEIAFQIGLLTLDGDSIPPAGSVSSRFSDVSAAAIPLFIRDRLPAADAPTFFSARATARHHEGRSYSRLSIVRHEVSIDWRTTEWCVTYNVGSEPPHNAMRIIVGETFQLPDYTEASPSDDPVVVLKYAIERQRRFRELQQDTSVPAEGQHGPWPEPGLVVPEGEQLLNLIAVLQQRGADA